ncbi:MAG: hypothetical protein AVDCRST_MAG77-3161 [uncultured Chloroflexi bacterium]|uniref:Uncharacterized protein n=1 Tax=uncultured Chloroflexota bacterium TaxID=166587 RepID=A0A6J4JA04_9CHLR|nr:MAG: hypothetical protein AVDCRST_MAG77-3161 [uncultured Chloroflexota bacterium]
MAQDTSLTEPNTAKYGEIESTIQKALVPVWNGEQDARSALQTISGPITALLPK